MSQSSRQMPNGPLARWARLAARNPWKVIGSWAVVIVIFALLANAFGGEFDSSFTLPGSESQQAIELLQEKFPEAAGDSATIIFRANEGSISDPAVQAEIDQLLAEAATLPNVAGMITPEMNPLQISEDGTIAYVVLQYEMQAMEMDEADVEAVFHLVDSSNSELLQVEAGGTVVSMGETPELGSSEIVGIAIAMVIMLVMFGSVIAMGLPIITAVVGVGMAMLIAPLFANTFTMNDMITTAFISMMGLGVGIDYALFILNRYRDNLLHGMDVENAVGVAINTAGRSVGFAGTTVAIGLLGLSLIRIPFVTGLGIAGSLVVVLSVVIALLLMPAVLGLVGDGVLKWRIPGLGNGNGDKNTPWFNWGRRIQAKPGVYAVISLLVLGVLASPMVDMHLGLSDAGNNPETMHSRRAYDLMVEGFGPGANGPLLIIVESENGFDQQAAMGMYMQLMQVEGVDAVLPMPNEEGTAAILQITPSTGPQDPETESLIHTLRNDFLPSMTEGTDIQAYVGGATAANIDLSETISDRMPIFYAVVVGLSVVLLMIVFQSIFVPIKAALTTLLSVGATFGAVVAVFQWGWMTDLLGIAGTGPVESFLPMILFGVLFGLSMDYEVFLLSRVHEEQVHGTDAKEAMLDGVGYSGKVVAAAGAIMAAVFLSFVLEDMRMIQMLGFGLGFAILVDAFLVRLVLVPAVMTMVGKWAWWMPAGLKRVIPNINIEGEMPLEANVAPESAD